MRRTLKHLLLVVAVTAASLGGLSTGLRRVWPRVRRAMTRWRVAWVTATVVAMVVAVGAAPANADFQDPADNTCISQSSATVSLSASSLLLGQSATLSWSLHPAALCPMLPYLAFYDNLTGRKYVQWSGTTISTPVSGSPAVTPQANGHYQLEVLSRGNFYVMASSAAESVTLPVLKGRPLASITRGGDQAALFAQGVTTPNAMVAIRGDVELDLSFTQSPVVAPGVQIVGQRDAAHPSGPRLFAVSGWAQHQVLSVGDGSTPSDNVRITGIRFDGGESSDPCDEANTAHTDVFGVEVKSSQNVEIDHNEFYHFNGGGVAAGDPLGRLNRENSRSFLVHDNYIHDNQHPTYCGLNPLDDTSGYGAGYGVIVGGGAFATVEHNVFSDNRHAIASDGADGTGYLLTGNLLIRPGLETHKLLGNGYSQQIDVHGQWNCPEIHLSSSHNCGPAGEYFSVSQNTVVGFNDPLTVNVAIGIELRGTPTSWHEPQPTVDGMQVVGNVFAQSRDTALTQTVKGLVDAGGNSFSADLTAFYNSGGAPCDFDGDHANDRFRASGASWWYYSSRAGRWVALATSASTSVTFSDANGDGLCDVTDAGNTRITTPWLESFPGLATTVPNLIGANQGATTFPLTSAGLTLGAVTTAANAAAVGTIISTTPAARAAIQVGTPVNIVVSSGPPPNVRVPNLVGGDQRGAGNALRSSGLVLGDVSQANYDNVSAGLVAAQFPLANAMVPPGTSVGIAISLGPEGGGGGGGCFASVVC
jgi:parallel beta helix pectate lyase-like protein/PASTA domain-containing protein